jgi:cytochrome c oxidase subunit 1
MFIAVPIGIKIFNWLATMWHGEMTFETPMLFAMAFLMLFTIGGCSGLMLGMVPADFQYHHTYFVVAHFHYVLVSGAIFAMMAGAYYWLPRWTGYMYDERLGKLHFWLSAVSVNLLFFPQHFLGLAGMPRRVPDYSTQFSQWNAVSSVGGFVFGLSQLILIWVVIKCIRGKGQRASDQVWDGARGLEWTLSSPPSYESFKDGIDSQKS